MIRRDPPSKAERLRSGLYGDECLIASGAYDGLGAALVEQERFDAIWSSSLALSASRRLPDASLLTMTDYLEAAVHMNSAASLPVIADCDTGFGNALNVAHAVHEFESAGIAAICIEDKVFPKLNSFIAVTQHLLPADEFAHKIATAKAAQRTSDFVVIARTEALITGAGMDEALRRLNLYADAGADAVLIHSKAPTPHEVVEFCARWQRPVPVVVVPTTYYTWSVEQAREAGVSLVIYANHTLRATVQVLSEVLREIREAGSSAGIEERIASMSDIFTLQRLDEWMALEK